MVPPPVDVEVEPPVVDSPPVEVELPPDPPLEVDEELPPDPPLLYELHVNLLRHGQRVCSFSDPKCGGCVLRDRCDAYAVFGDSVPTFVKG